MNSLPDNIKDTMAKLAEMARRGATRPEREAAERILARLMDKHGLTEKDLRDTMTREVYFFFFRPGERQLFLQCFVALFNVPHVPCVHSSREKISVFLTKTEAADLEDCFEYYRFILAEQRERIKCEAKELKQQMARLASQRKNLLTAMIREYDLYPKSHSKTKKASKEDQLGMIDALLNLDREAWQKRKGTIEDRNLLLENGG